MEEPSTDRDHWFETLADHLGAAYLRYSFTKGTVQEVDHLMGALRLAPGMRLLDVGCGPGRHAQEFARRGVEVHGIDISERFVELATAAAVPGATFERLDARALAFTDEFDAAVSLCQGAFGLLTGPGEDEQVLRGIARAVRPGGRVGLSAFSAYFAVKYHDTAEFDADRGISHEHTEVRSESGEALAAELWTGCYTPRELRLLLARCGVEVERISSVEPGAYGDDPPTLETPEFLVIGHVSDRESR